jgi:flagellar basal-body rod modification protein FlgD
MSNPITANPDATASTTDFLKLFMQELTYQDPLKPIDNREFMAQMAQFSSLQATHNTNELLNRLINVTSANQSLELLNKEVKLHDSDKNWKVNKVTFSATELKLSLNSPPDNKEVTLGDIKEVLGR